MTKEMRESAKAQLGDLAADMNDEQIENAIVLFAHGAGEVNAELSATNEGLQTQITTLSTSNQALQTQVTELSATKPDDVVELSATEKKLIGENLTLKIDGIADKQQWPDAYRAEVKTTLTGGNMIALSAGATDDAPAVSALLLDLLAKRPAKALKADGTEITPAQTTTTLLGRVEEDAPPPAKNSLLETATAMAPKA